MTRRSQTVSISLGLASTLAVSLLAGCSASFQPNALQTERASIGTIEGSVHGGQAPVSGGHIYLYAAGSTGYAAGARSLLTAASNTTADGNGNYYVVTDAAGNFSLSGDYTCTQGDQIYLVAVGGNPGLTTGTNNTAIVQMAGLGNCPASGTLAQQVPYVVINEVSTVVFAYAMGGYGTTAYNVASSATTLGKAGIANAMQNVFNVLNIQYGQSPTVANGNSNSVVPQSKIYTLANILAACVNTSSAASSQCTSLFGYATSDGTTTGAKATNETEAIFNIVHHPTANVTGLFNLQPTATAFSPSLSAAPKDWTLPVVYTGVVTTPFNIAFDTDGTAWIGDEARGVVKIGPQGAVSTINKGFGSVKGVAVAPSGSIWVADYNNSQIYIMNTAGTVSSTLTNNGLKGPSAVAFDATGNAWVSNDDGSSVSKFDSNGNSVAPNHEHTMQNIGNPAWIAVDPNGNAWVPSTNTNYIGELRAGNGNTKGNYYLISSSDSYALALDASSNIWVGNTANKGTTATPTLYKVDSTGTLQASYTGGGLDGAFMVAVDGAGSVWVSNQSATVVSGISNGGSWLATAGFDTGATGGCFAATPDGSGNLWTANADGSVTELLGLSAPTATPMIPGNLGVRP